VNKEGNMASILLEFEGLTKNRVKTVMKKIDHCGFNTIATHVQVQCTDLNKELATDEQQEDKLDIQPVQPNSIYIKCDLLQSADKYAGKGDASIISKKRNMSPTIKQMVSPRGINSKPTEGIIPTETPIEDELETFDLKVAQDIVFRNPSKTEVIGFYNKNANILWISDLVHNPLRAEYLLDRAISYVYEYQKVGSLNVITPIFDKFQKDLEKLGLSGGALWWTGFEDSKDKAVIDGRLDPKKFLEAQVEELIKAGVDIFFLRNLKNYDKGCEITIEKCKGKVVISNGGYGGDPVIQVPAHTTIEQEVKAIEDYVSTYASDIASDFYKKARKDLDVAMSKVKK